MEKKNKRKLEQNINNLFALVFGVVFYFLLFRINKNAANVQNDELLKHSWNKNVFDSTVCIGGREIFFYISYIQRGAHSSYSCRVAFSLDIFGIWQPAGVDLFISAGMVITINIVLW